MGVRCVLEVEWVGFVDGLDWVGGGEEEFRIFGVSS